MFISVNQVRKKRLNLLNHPVVGSLLHQKWNAFGIWVYLLNLFMYIVFLSFLTAFALEVPNPQADICKYTPLEFVSCC